MRLVIFDVDGTLVDSQNNIVASAEAAFAAQGLIPPAREAILGIVGLSLPQAMEVLAPEQSPQMQARLVEFYKDGFSALRASGSHPPLFEGAKAVLDALLQEDETILAVATGKSRRGLDAMIELHGLTGYFNSLQCADDHPSKPHPSMVLTACAAAGIAPAHAVMVGDTTFDIDMGHNAGAKTVSVEWGYHPSHLLKAHRHIHHFNELPAAITAVLE